MGLLSSLHSGASGLSVNQKGIEVAGNNVANVNTPGYSRQSLRLSPAPTLEFKGKMIGQGSTIAAIDRQSDNFILGQLNKKAADYGETDAKTAPLAEIERIVGIGSGSIDKDISKFFDAWQKLSKNPAGKVERQQVMQKGSDLAGNIRKAAKDLQATVDGINTKLQGDLTNLNRQLREIADLNTQITSAESTGISSNALRDQRDLLIKEVSQTTGATAFPESNGMVSMQLPSGIPLISADKASQIEAISSSGTLQLRIRNGATTTTLGRNDFGGAIKGQLDVRDKTIPRIIDKLDKLAYNLARTVNTAHNGGVDTSGNSGQNFFSTSGGTPQPWSGAASTLTMRLTDTDQVAAGTGSSYRSGDNSNTLNMVKLRDAKVVENSSLNDYFAAIASDVGLEVNQNKQNLSSTKDAKIQMENMRNATSGVSIDDELLMLIKYQKGYEAAAKYLTTVNEMLKTLMRM